MSIRTISTEQLRCMGDQEGLILQDCGGDPQEWLDGINQILTEEAYLEPPYEHQPYGGFSVYGHRPMTASLL